jgi:hypothetical protein
MAKAFLVFGVMMLDGVDTSHVVQMILKRRNQTSTRNEGASFPPFSSLSSLQFPFPLRVFSRSRAPRRPNSGGFAAWGREGRDARPVQSSVRIFGSMPVLGFMPVEWGGAAGLSGQICCRLGFFRLDFLFLRLERRVMRRTTVSFNKAEVSTHLLVQSFCVGRTPPAGRGGEGRKNSCVLFGAVWRWGVLQAATCGGHQQRRGCAAVIFGRRGHSVLRCLVRLSFSFLLAGVPSWRIFTSSAAAFIAGPSPSGAVPGDGAGGRGVELLVNSGGEGPDGVFLFLSGVLSVKFEGYVVISFSSVVLCVICKPTV